MHEKIGLVVSDYNADITHTMEKLANEHAEFLGIPVVKTIHVPGVFDMPLAVKKLLEKPEIDGVVTLGAVIEGDTSHDDVVGGNAARKVCDLSVQFNKPVSLGVSGPKMSHAQGIKRLEGYSKRAVESCVKMIRAVK